jgi:hypothetical protein
MPLLRQIARWGAWRVARRVAVSLPFAGAAIAAATIGIGMRRKGVLGGALDAGLNALPYVGAAKNTLEAIRGRDFVPDRSDVSRADRPDLTTEPRRAAAETR